MCDSLVVARYYLVRKCAYVIIDYWMCDSLVFARYYLVRKCAFVIIDYWVLTHHYVAVSSDYLVVTSD